MESGNREERFLFLGSKYNLFCIDLKKTKENNDNDKCSKFSYKPVVAEVVWSTDIHTTTSWLPFGMSSTRFDFKAATCSSSSSSTTSTSSSGSDIFLIGGELQTRSSPYCSTDASKQVYKLVPEISSSNGDLEDISIELARDTVPEMNSGKACPIVEEINGDLYVLHSRFIHGSFDAQPEIPFEVFESKVRKWGKLPAPPFFTARSATVIYAHAVIGICFVIETSTECFSFNVVKKEWRRCSDNITAKLINHLPMMVYSGQEYLGRPLCVGISLLIKPSAHLVKSDGTIFASQPLHEVICKDILPDPDHPPDKNVLIPLKSSKDDVIRMCACFIVSSIDFPDGRQALPDGCQALAVSFFNAKISSSLKGRHRHIRPRIYDDPAQSSILDVTVERKFFFEVPKLDCFFNGPALLL